MSVPSSISLELVLHSLICPTILNNHIPIKSGNIMIIYGSTWDLISPKLLSPVKEWNFYLFRLHHRDTITTGLRRDPLFDKSNRQIPLFFSFLGSSSLAGCIRIQPTPSLLQSVLKHVSLSESNLARNWDEVMHFYRSSNRNANAPVHAENSICFL